MDKPLVSVVFPAYNAGNTVKESIDSIISQTYDNWELIAIDDGSADNTAEIIQSYKDVRVKYVKNETNLGLIKTLNRAIGYCTGKYIARMDSDDIAEPERFQKQVDYLELHPKVIVCGSAIKMFGSKDGKSYDREVHFLTEDKDLKDYLIKEPCFAHPAVMMRRDVLERTGLRYKENYDYAEDYKLWIDLMNYGDYHNLPEVLLNYRLSNTQMTQKSTMVHPSIPSCRWDYIESRYGADIVNILKEAPISVRTLKKIRRIIDNCYLLEILYLSMSKYSANTIFYFFVSGDNKVLGNRFAIRLINRIINNKTSKL